MNMDIRPIHTQADYDAALSDLSALFDLGPDEGTAEGDRMEVLMAVVGAYEDKHFHIPAPDPIEAIKFRMEQAELTAADMVPYIGPKHRVYEVLNGTRQLTLPMIRRLHVGLGIPAESLIGTAELEHA
jgi:HTH-type transcriptional regulator/antitoxin HigA